MHANNCSVIVRGNVARMWGAHGYASLNAADACVEESLTGLPAFSAHVAWRPLVALQLDRDRGTRRTRRVRPLLVRRARSVAARGGSSLHQFRCREGDAGTRAHLRDQRPRDLRRRFSAAGVGARRQRAARIRRRAVAAARQHSRGRDATALAGGAVESTPAAGRPAANARGAACRFPRPAAGRAASRAADIAHSARHRRTG